MQCGDWVQGAVQAERTMPVSRRGPRAAGQEAGPGSHVREGGMHLHRDAMSGEPAG